MKKLPSVVAVVCVLSIAASAQNRHKGYNANGGWHRKASASHPRTADGHKQKPAKPAKTAVRNP